MYSFFNLKATNKIFRLGDLDNYSKSFESFVSSQITTVRSCLDNLSINSNGIISAQQIKEDWFPEINADIFLSHSHADEKLALALAGWFKNNFDLNVFIDSTVWGYKNDLLREFDNMFSKKDEFNYDYNASIYTAAHVDTILTLALQKMIHKTECLIFLNTNNSIIEKPQSEYLNERNSPCTFSPWIYAELEFANMVERITPYRLIKESKDRATNMSSTPATIQYKINLKRSLCLNANHLNELIQTKTRGSTALDELYRIVSK